MNPEEFFSMNNNPNYEIGQGKRGLRSESELSNWDPTKVYVKCTTCSATSTPLKTAWLENIPLTCLNNHETLAHEFIVPGSFTKEIIKTYNPDGSVSLKEDLITEPFRQACIVRYVKIKTV